MSNRSRVIGFVAAFALLPAIVTGCGARANEQPTITVHAAASLTESFRQIGERFGEKHPDLDVRFNFQGSSLLAEQIRQGAGGDVFASANTKMMTKVERADAVAGQPRVFAQNRLTIVVPPENPAEIRSFGDLTKTEASVVVCAPQVPCGSATEQVERATGVRLKPVSEENDVKDVLHKVTAGEADAGVVYVTDAHAAGDKVRAVDFPAAQRAKNDYPIATLADAEHPRAAEKFVSFVRGPQGREILRENGFEAP